MMHNSKRLIQRIPRWLSYIPALPSWFNGYDFSKAELNGEYRFLRQYIRPGMTIFDIGANVGHYSQFVLSLQRNVAAIHCFEPVTATYQELAANLQTQLNSGTRLVLNNMGLSNQPGVTYINVYDQHSEWNSLYDVHVDNHVGDAENIKVTKQEIKLSTVDQYVGEQQIQCVDLMKLDVEGSELSVLEGARHSLEAGIIRCVQFEYNVPFMKSGATLAAMFQLLSSCGFAVYRLLPLGKKQIKSFTPDLENYRYSNWVCLQKR